MGTRSRIGIENADGTVTSIYCHWDGYVSHNGRILAEHYTDDKKVRQLIKLGDISSLGEKVAPPKYSAHTFDNELPGVTVAYGRDRDEKDTDAVTSPSLEAFTEGDFEEYGYVYRGDGWWVISAHDEKGLRQLSRALVEEEVA